MDPNEFTMGDFLDVLPQDDQWHRFHICNNLFDAKYGGVFAYNDDGTWGS